MENGKLRAEIQLEEEQSAEIEDLRQRLLNSKERGSGAVEGQGGETQYSVEGSEGIVW